jgi:hypothetical protein
MPDGCSEPGGPALEIVERVADDAPKGAALANIERTEAQEGYFLEAGVLAGLELGDAQAGPGLRGLDSAQFGAERALSVAARLMYT